MKALFTFSLFFVFSTTSFAQWEQFYTSEKSIYFADIENQKLLDPTKKLISIPVKSIYNNKREKQEIWLMSCQSNQSGVLKNKNHLFSEKQYKESKNVIVNNSVLRLQSFDPKTNPMLAQLKQLSCKNAKN